MKVIILMTIIYSGVFGVDAEIVRVPSLKVCEEYKAKHEGTSPGMRVSVTCDRFGGEVTK